MQKTTKLILAIAGVGGVLYLLSKKRNGFKDKELGKLVDDLKQMPDLEKAITEQSWVDKRPTYENAVFEDLESYLATNPNAHLIRKGWMRDFSPFEPKNSVKDRVWRAHEFAHGFGYEWRMNWRMDSGMNGA